MGLFNFYYKGDVKMELHRRSFIKKLAGAGALAVAAAAGLLRPLAAIAGEWKKDTFESKDLASALKALGADSAVDSKDVVIKAPTIAENGAVVPIDAASNIPGTTRLIVLVDKNPNPLAGDFEFSNGALPDISLRLKFRETSSVRVIAVAGGKFYSAQKEVKVTLGGCGG